MKRAQLLNTKAQMSSIWAEGYMLMIVFGVHQTQCLPTPPWCREKVMVYYYSQPVNLNNIIETMIIALKCSQFEMH